MVKKIKIFSNSMQDKTSRTSPARNRSRIIVSATNTNGKIMGGGVVNNKSISFLLLFLIFSFIFMVIAEGEGGQIGEQEIFSKKGLLSVQIQSSRWQLTHSSDSNFEYYIENNKTGESINIHNIMYINTENEN